MKYKNNFKVKNVLSIILLLIVTAFIITCILLVRVKLLQNTQEFGTLLAQSYAVEQQMKFENLEQNVNLASEYVQEMIANKEDKENIQKWLDSYFHNLENIVGESLSAYAVINGEIVASDPWEGDSTYDYSSKSWYKDAIDADGKIVISDVYYDVITQKPICTLSKKISGEGNVLALDIYSQNEHLQNTIQSLPAKSSLYLCDSKGNLLYGSTIWDISYDELQSYVDYLQEGIKNGEYESYDSYFVDLDNVNRGVYYYTLDVGWTVIITIPFEEILIGQSNSLMYILAVIGVIVFIAIFVIVVRDTKRSKVMKKTINTMLALGDAYFAIFRVNFVNGSYEVFKLSDSINSPLLKTGNYENLINRVKDCIEVSSFEEFEKNYSLDAICKRVKDKIKDFGGDYRYKFTDGYKWVNIRTLYDSSFALDEVIMCFREVDKEKKYQLQNVIALEEAIAESEKSVKAKNEFFSHMSHDMRTPLNAIISFSELAKINCESKDKVADYLDKINISGKQLLNLINDILEMSAIEAGKNTLNCKSFNLKNYIEDNCSLFQEQATKENKKFTLLFDIKDETVIGDCHKISQILNNLLSNAFKYSNSGSEIKLEIRQFDFQKYSKYQFVVSDNGIGMSKEFVEKVFEPYMRETDYSDKHIVGTGLGMSIVKSIVKQMNGEISVESTLGVGSTFTVTLPIEVETNCEKSANGTSQTDENLNLKGKRILLAEDNELNREIATELLEMAGCQVLSAVNGKEAVELFENSQLNFIDAVLMDMQMPVMDGCEAAEKIRSLKRTDAQTIPIIAVTANAFAEDIDKTTNSGMNAHISKPIDINVLLKTLKNLLKQK